MKGTDFIINTFFRVATGGAKVRTLLTPVGAILFLLLLGFFIAISLWLDRLAGFPVIFPSPLNVIISVSLLLPGIILMSWSALHFLRTRGTPVPFNPPPRVVSTGPYAHCRNPMVSGIFFIFFGLGSLLQSLSLLCIFTPIFIFLNVVELKIIEEPELEKRLGQEYLDYQRSTPMFFPRWNRLFFKSPTGNR